MVVKLDGISGWRSLVEKSAQCTVYNHILMQQLLFYNKLMRPLNRFVGCCRSFSSIREMPPSLFS